jgi:hypothetical protein
MAAPKKKKYALDIFATLRALDRKEYDYLDRLTPEERKGFVPRTVLRWMGSTDRLEEYHILAVNEFANVNFDDLYHYPDLQYRMLAAAGSGSPQRRPPFLPVPKQGKSPAKVQTFVAKFYPLASTAEIDLLVAQFTRETFIDFANYSGCSATEIKDAIDAFDKKEGGGQGKA